MFDPGVIISCQPRLGGPFLLDGVKFAAEAEYGGAVAVRIEGLNNVRNARDAVKISVIGLVKEYVQGFVWITPTFAEACALAGHGADYIAMDATGRWGWDEIKRTANSFPTIGDIAHIEQALMAQEIGCVAVTTALSGYTTEKKAYPFHGPDVELVRQCAEQLRIPVIAEGRIWTPKQLAAVKDAGAHSVCIGGAATDVARITEHWRVCWTGEWKAKREEWAPR